MHFSKDVHYKLFQVQLQRFQSYSYSIAAWLLCHGWHLAVSFSSWYAFLFWLRRPPCLWEWYAVSKRPHTQQDHLLKERRILVMLCSQALWVPLIIALAIYRTTKQFCCQHSIMHFLLVLVGSFISFVILRSYAWFLYPEVVKIYLPSTDTPTSSLPSHLLTTVPKSSNESQEETIYEFQVSRCVQRELYEGLSTEESLFFRLRNWCGVRMKQIHPYWAIFS